MAIPILKDWLKERRKNRFVYIDKENFTPVIRDNVTHEDFHLNRNEILYRLNRMDDEMLYWKNSLHSVENENQILLNEIFLLLEQGAKTSPAFEEWMIKQRKRDEKYGF